VEIPPITNSHPPSTKIFLIVFLLFRSVSFYYTNYIELHELDNSNDSCQTSIIRPLVIASTFGKRFLYQQPE